MFPFTFRKVTQANTYAHPLELNSNYYGTDIKKKYSNEYSNIVHLIAFIQQYFCISLHCFYI